MDHRRDDPPAAALFSTSSPAPPATSEDSALFSLQSLRDAALRRTESDLPEADASPVAAPTARVSSEPAPMFNAGARLTMQPLSAAQKPRANVSPPSAGVVYAVLGLLAGVVIGMGALVLQDPPTVVVQRDDANALGSLSVSEAQRRHVEGDLSVRRPSRRGEPAANATEEPSKVEDTSESSEATDTPRAAVNHDTSERRAMASRGSTTSRSSAESTRSASVKDEPAEPPSPPATTKTTRTSKSSQPDPSVACILDPASCGLGGTSSSGSTSSTNKPTSKPADLPAKLTSSALRSALAPAKARASRCGEMHVVPGGTKVRVRLSIAGSTGKVTQATPQSPHDDAVGRCVANELAQTTFPRFAATSMGILYSVRL